VQEVPRGASPSTDLNNTVLGDSILTGWGVYDNVMALQWHVLDLLVLGLDDTAQHV